MLNFKQYLAEDKTSDSEIRQLIKDYKEGNVGSCRFPNKFPIHSVKDGKIHLKNSITISSCMFDENDELIFPFGTISDNFVLITSRFTSFKNFPERIFSDLKFQNRNDKITSLQGITPTIGGKCSITQLPNVSLSHIDQHIRSIGGNLIINADYRGPILSVLKIKNLKGIGYDIIAGGKIQSYFDASKSDIHKISNIINEYIKEGKHDIISCQDELMDKGLGDYAKL